MYLPAEFCEKNNLIGRARPSVCLSATSQTSQIFMQFTAQNVQICSKFHPHAQDAHATPWNSGYLHSGTAHGARPIATPLVLSACVCVCVCVCVVLLQYFVSLIVMLVVLVVTVAVAVWALVQRAAVSTQLRNFSHSRWLGSRAVSVLDSGAEGPGFKSQPRRCRVTVLGKLFTPIVPLFTKQQNW